MSETFSGDKKKGTSILGPYERRFINWAVPKIPAPIMSQHLTYITIGWSAGIILAGWLADTYSLGWLHVMSVMVAGQWLTDSLDGSLGKYRKQGLVKWGFFMDHLLDLFFAGSVVIGYSFLVDASWLKFLFMLLLLVTTATMAVSFLSFAATNQFQIAYYGIGPTEIRIGYIALNTFVVFVGTDIFSWGVPLILGVNVVSFLVMTVQSSRMIWQIDYEDNADGQPRP
jgi:archaetidylinositol phosphate synthase